MARNYRNVVIRQAKPKDSNLLLNAEKQIALERPGQMLSQPHELKTEDFNQKIGELSDHPRGVYLIAQVGDEIVGHAFLDPTNLEAMQHVAYMTTAVHHGHQGNGVGEKLTQNLIEWARSRSQLEKIELQVRSSNNPALSLYKKVGFQEEGRRLRRIKLGDQYLDDILMGLWL